MKFKLKISNGEVAMIYNDQATPALFSAGHGTITRASYVEPDCNGNWTADMSPVAPGVVLGPFKRRQDAINAEVAYLEALLF